MSHDPTRPVRDDCPSHQYIPHSAHKQQTYTAYSQDPAIAKPHTIPDTYVDTDFYAALLNEFLDANTTVAANKLHKAPKQRKIVDRRASKGRKLRYQIHEKLVNFMAPEEEQRAGYTAQIFANLFGHKRTV